MALLPLGPTAAHTSAAAVPLTATMTLPDGTVVSAVGYDSGRSALSVGHVETQAFLRDAGLVFAALGTGSGPDELEEHCVVRRHALLREKSDGSLRILWTVTNTGDRVDQYTPGAVAVTLSEI